MKEQQLSEECFKKKSHKEEQLEIVKSDKAKSMNSSCKIVAIFHIMSGIEIMKIHVGEQFCFIQLF